MAPRNSKQSDRKVEKKASKGDDEPATEGAGILAAVKQLALGSVLVKVAPTLPKLLKETKQVEKKEEEKENNEPSTENKEESAAEEKPQNAASVFAGLGTRLTVPNSLGLDEDPEESLALFTRLEVDFGPFKRKKGNAALERIVLNVERNMSQYINITFALMVLNALAFRSWFACLPWLVVYQLVSLNLPMELIRENVPQVPEVDSKFRVAATIAVHGLVWFFFVYEVLFQTYFLAKFPLIALFVLHAYIAAPEVNLEAARKAIAEKKGTEGDEEVKPPAAGVANVASLVAVTKMIIMSSFLVKLFNVAPQLINELKALKEPKKAEEKKEGEEKEGEEKKAASTFETLLESLSLYNVLGLGLPSSKESWMNFKSLQLDFGPKAKRGSPVTERLMTNVERNMPQYIHIALVVMCLRSFLFRSWFACLPWLAVYQMLCVSLPLIRTKVPQIPPVDSVLMVTIAGVFHAFVWLFFAYEAVLMTHVMEKFLLAALFTAHAYVVSPVLN